MGLRGESLFNFSLILSVGLRGESFLTLDLSLSLPLEESIGTLRFDLGVSTSPLLFDVFGVTSFSFVFFLASFVVVIFFSGFFESLGIKFPDLNCVTYSLESSFPSSALPIACSSKLVFVGSSPATILVARTDKSFFVITSKNV